MTQLGGIGKGDFLEIGIITNNQNAMPGYLWGKAGVAR